MRAKQRTDERRRRRARLRAAMEITNGGGKTNGANGEKQLPELAERHARNGVG